MTQSQLYSAQESPYRQAVTQFTTAVDKHKWMGHVLRHDGLLHDILEGKMLDTRTTGRRIQLTDDSLEKKNYTDLKKQLKTEVF